MCAAHICDAQAQYGDQFETMSCADTDQVTHALNDPMTTPMDERRGQQPQDRHDPESAIPKRPTGKTAM